MSARHGARSGFTRWNGMKPYGYERHPNNCPRVGGYSAKNRKNAKFREDMKRIWRRPRKVERRRVRDMLREAAHFGDMPEERARKPRPHQRQLRWDSFVPSGRRLWDGKFEDGSEPEWVREKRPDGSTVIYQGG